MQVKLLASAALFSSLSLAQLQGVDQNLVSRLSADAAAIVANPTWSAALNAIASAAPASALASAGSNPSILFNQIVTDTTDPAWVSSIPTSVIGALATALAPAINADADFNAYISSAAAQPAGFSLLNALYSAAPTSVQAAYSSNKLDLAAAVIASTPAWASNIPVPVQTSLAAVYNSALRIEVSDLEIGGGRTASKTGTASYTRRSSTGTAPFATARPSTCPACPACTPVTVYTTITASPSVSGSSSSSSSATTSKSSSFSSSLVPSTNFLKPTTPLASNGFPPKPPTTTPSVVVVNTTTPSVVAFSKTSSASVVAFTGGAAPVTVRGMGKVGAVGAVVVVVGMEGLFGV